MHNRFSILNSLFSFILVLSILLFAGPFVQAADGSETGGDASVPSQTEFSFHLGSLLPNQINSVSEIMPAIGFRLNLPVGYGSIEPEFMSSHAHGVDYQIFSASLRGDLVPLPDINALIYAGPDIHYYKGIDMGSRMMIWGLHFGTGIMMSLGGPFWLRADMKFNMNPGTALYIGFGFAMKLGGPTGGN